jgi:DNA polymerase-3 subunit alpha (Gram-positive type)
LAGPEAIKEKIKDIKRRRSSGEAITKKEEDMIDDVYKISLECYARGIIFKNVDLAKSDAKKFIIEGNTLIIPFSKIDGLGETVARSIVEARKVSPFKNIEDFKARTKINKKTLLELTELGALDNMDENDQISLTNFFN